MTGAEIRARRRAYPLDQVELAAMVGVTRAAVSMWERGARTPWPRHLRALRTVFGLAPRGRGQSCAAGCGCACHGRLPKDAMAVLTTRRRTA